MAILDPRRIPREKIAPQAEPTNVPELAPPRWGLGEREICSTVVETASDAIIVVHGHSCSFVKGTQSDAEPLQAAAFEGRGLLSVNIY
jgi:hypothetical protein